jgi:hypothetical protein
MGIDNGITAAKQPENQGFRSASVKASLHLSPLVAARVHYKIGANYGKSAAI